MMAKRTGRTALLTLAAGAGWLATAGCGPLWAQGTSPGAAVAQTEPASAAPQTQPTAPAPQTEPTPQQRAAAIKQQLQASQAKLRAYEWIETTSVTRDGKPSARTQKRCYYGADGALQKIVLEQTASQPHGGPMMRHVAEQKKKEMEAYMERATELLHSYVPPIPGLIQRSIDAGRLAVGMVVPGRRARLTFTDYLKPGDSLAIEIDVQGDRPRGVHVDTYLDTREEPVRLEVQMAALADGTTYVQRTQLDAQAKGVVVVVENAGYRRLAP
jgi:hypothetical protein